VNATVRPIHLPGAAALELLRARAQAALDGWAAEWVVGWGGDALQADALQLRVAPTEAVQSVPLGFEALCAEAGCIWFGCGAADRSELGRAVVGAELMPGAVCADDWIADAVDRAWEARNRALCTALLGAPSSEAWPASPTALPAQLFAVGSGAVQLSCDAIGLQAIADGGVWQAMPPGERSSAQRLPAPAALSQAARRATARLEVVLGSVELELPKLLDLRCGDVLRLPQRLDEQLAVLCDGKPLAHAMLGEAQGRKCVQLFSLPHPDPRNDPRTSPANSPAKRAP